MSVLTPTIEGREDFLEECRRSVLYQTFGRWEHLRLLDDTREGCAKTMNTLAEKAEGQWLLPLADDDILLPACLELLMNAAPSYDVVYSPPIVWGVENPWWFFGEPPAIPSFGLIRADLWREIGGYDYDWNREEDRRFWQAAMDKGARFFRYSERPTWVYRVHSGSKSFNNGNAS